MKLIVLLIVALIFILVRANLALIRQEPEIPRFIPVPELIESAGYPSEVHYVTTEDGYVLEMHRIPYGRNSISPMENQPIALLVHCIFCTSAVWVMQGADNALSFMLADEGYDVWMLNVRGTTQSKNHTRLSTKSKKFWNFSWHEMAIYDVPAAIDFILTRTKEKQLNYIGYSMGTTLFFALVSVKPEYNKKIKKMMALAPACYLSHSKGMMMDLSIYVRLLEQYAYDTHMYELPPAYLNAKEILRSICDYNNPFLWPKCAQVFKTFADSSIVNLKLDKLKFFFFYYPDTSSVKTTLHFFQVKNSGKFQAYDYGGRGNMNKYGSWTPPKYNLSQITVPVYLFYSQDDNITSMKDVIRLKKKLPNIQANYRINIPFFSHGDYGWATYVKQIVYQYVLQALRNPVKQ